MNGDLKNSIKAHKAILMARSEKFRAMIESHMRESHTSKVEVIDEDINA